jgi:DNA-binding HxlR family transcriptional regulator
MSPPRSYEDPCGIARALYRVGERWALLVVRELLLGPKRFGDLRAGLPDASPNVLSQRLRELEACGVVARCQLPAPASAMAYELTPWGHELEAVLLALARWGSRAGPPPPGELSPDALMLALRTTFDATSAAGLKARLELRLGLERYALEVARGKLAVTRGPCPEPDAAVIAEPATLRQVVFGGREQLARARREGALLLEGDAALAGRVLALFPRPRPAP